MVEVLLSAMNQNDFSLVDKSNINTDVLIINQSNEEKVEEDIRSFGKVRMITCSDRGLSKSRNLALMNSTADICILCDDDVKYVNNYRSIIENAFKELPDADVIVFNIKQINSEYQTERMIERVTKIPSYKAYGSVRIAFKRKSIIDNNISFNELFGAGSGMYGMAEDSLFFRNIHKCKLNAYTYPQVIAEVNFSSSTWFNGFNEKYYYDMGAYLSAAYPVLKYLFMFYYPIRTRKMTRLSVVKILAYIVKGFFGYRHGVPYLRNDNIRTKKEKD